MELLRRPISASDRIQDRFYVIGIECLSLSRRRSSAATSSLYFSNQLSTLKALWPRVKTSSLVTLDSRKLRDLRIESRDLGCEVLSTYFWAVLYYLLTRCTGPDVHMKCIKNKNILQFCSQVRPNTKIHRLDFSAKQDKQPFLFLFCCLKAFAHYRGMCMWVLTGDINGYCLFLGELNCFL